MTTRNVLVIPCVLWCMVVVHRSFAIQMTDSQIRLDAKNFCLIYVTYKSNFFLLVIIIFNVVWFLFVELY
jgi:hypothetical protein